jgi:hypothetical protein
MQKKQVKKLNFKTDFDYKLSQFKYVRIKKKRQEERTSEKEEEMNL